MPIIALCSSARPPPPLDGWCITITDLSPLPMRLATAFFAVALLFCSFPS